MFTYGPGRGMNCISRDARCSLDLIPQKTAAHVILHAPNDEATILYLHSSRPPPPACVCGCPLSSAAFCMRFGRRDERTQISAPAPWNRCLSTWLRSLHHLAVSAAQRPLAWRQRRPFLRFVPCCTLPKSTFPSCRFPSYRPCEYYTLARTNLSGDCLRDMGQNPQARRAIPCLFMFASSHLMTGCLLLASYHLFE
jgi:hypothetical protein